MRRTEERRRGEVSRRGLEGGDLVNTLQAASSSTKFWCKSIPFRER